ncbi:hypothetical protein KYT87_15270 [Achromobacter sp. ES-001]|uniref:hypothetical protein n=1 Tax=Achromobacter sp. ES-001 TaxID=2860286 RepID=UPI001C63DBDD|nr:hypothetical protein [Achromobacter sp. ES-001]QYJ19137.1 hypothetical protein KYT87_15270 [Achromobacter sp. ES-001]
MTPSSKANLPVRSILASLLAAASVALAASPAVAASDAPAPISQAAAARVAPPDVPSMLYAIYDVDGKGETTYEVANGSVATYWFGHAFESEGTHYYTGFAWDTADRYGKPGEDDVGPGTRVNLTEATFVLTDPASERPWKFRGMEPTIGEFGAYERGEDVDTRRKPLEFRTPAGKLLLAVPTTDFDNGITSTGYALLVFNPERLKEEVDGHVWTYVGSLLTGEDNSAACADGDVMPCTSSKGELVFSNDGKQDMPTVTVKPSGTTISGPNKTRQLGAADITAYVFDPASKAYVAK